MKLQQLKHFGSFSNWNPASIGMAKYIQPAQISHVKHKFTFNCGLYKSYPTYAWKNTLASAQSNNFQQQDQLTFLHYQLPEQYHQNCSKHPKEHGRQVQRYKITKKTCV